MDLVFISGASSGLGAALASHLAASVTVAGFARSPVGTYYSMGVDLSVPDLWPAVIAWMGNVVEEEAPASMGFFNCAAAVEPLGAAADVDPESYTENVLINSACPQVLGAGFARLAKEKAIDATLVLVSSGAAHMPLAGASSYGAGKAAGDQWARNVGIEPGTLRVLSIAPGVVDTPMQVTMRSASVDEVPDVAMFRDMHSNGILETPEAVAAKLWTAANDASHPSGSVLDLRQLG